MIDIANVAVPLDAFAPGTDPAPFFLSAAAKACGVAPEQVVSARLLRRSIDARKKSDVHFVVTLAVELTDAQVETSLVETTRAKSHVAFSPFTPDAWPANAPRPVVVGMGPAGLFAALLLAQAGARPLVVERGGNVEERAECIARFEKGGALNPDTNVVFGEGGAGTYSDGKLTTNTKNPRIARVLHTFVDAGASPDILVEAHPHIGSDRLPGVVANLRRRIEQAGGEVCFHTCLTDLALREGSLVSATFSSQEQGSFTIPVSQLVLAVGHSARDTFSLIHEKGFAMEAKSFSVGVRIEHLQKDMNRSQWGAAAEHPALGAAEYKAVVHLPGKRNVYTFCMCPGGTVVCASDSEGALCTNGMSVAARDGVNANAAVLVEVGVESFPDDDLFAGVRYQRDIERTAWEIARRNGGAPFAAPMQTVGSFLFGTPNVADKVHPTYARGTVPSDLHEVLPPQVADALAEALPLFDKRIHGFADPHAVMTAPETRSSSPVRIIRGADMQAFSVSEECVSLDRTQAGGTGLYPCGEGAGYAGGITSAAVDGLRVAEALISQVSIQ